MEDGSNEWRFNKKFGKKKEEIVTVRHASEMLVNSVNHDDDDERPVINLCRGDPSPFPSFQTAATAVDAVAAALRSARFNGYGPRGFGILPAKKAVAEHISKDLPYKLSPDDIYLTVGCKQAIQAIFSALAHSDANILMPKPGFSMYDAAATYSGVELRCYNLLPEKGWEVDLDSVEAAVDDNTLAIVIINPGNPCGNVYTHEHLGKVAETAKKLGLLVIADEVYAHIAFGRTPFVRMGVFAPTVPVITLGSISKRWIAPGWRLGWLVTTDPNGILQKSALLQRVRAYLSVAADPPTFIQAAVPEIIEKTKGEFFTKVIDVLRQDADIIFNELKEIPCITCPNKPEGSMFAMVKLNMSLLEGIQDDRDFSFRIAREEKVIVLPGSVIDMTNWLRISFAVEPSTLEEGLQRIKAFCRRNAKEQ